MPRPADAAAARPRASAPAAHDSKKMNDREPAGGQENLNTRGLDD
jgi:hypothetical protein